MTWKIASDAVWVALAVVIAGVAVLSHRSSRLVTCGETMRRLAARPAARAVVLLFWMWLGWHSFAR
jgi:hypothetical protein